jgi:hypothetical protein
MCGGCITQQAPQREASRHDIGQLCASLAPQSKTPPPFAKLRCKTCGLGRNRSIDTQIFNVSAWRFPFKSTSYSPKSSREIKRATLFCSVNFSQADSPQHCAV